MSKVSQLIEISANIDDMNPQWYGPVMDKLFELGALDVVLVPMIMKKSRPGIQIQVLAKPALKKKIIQCLFEETTTLGVRVAAVERYELSREMRSVKTSYGIIPVKIARNEKGKVVNVWPEFEECLKIAQKKKIPLKKIVASVMGAIASIADMKDAT